MSVSAEEQLSILTRGASDTPAKDEFMERLKKPLRVKCGFDPTRPDLHLGHAVVMSKMRQFQDFGHTVILLVGDFTAMVGDPTGKNEARPALTREEVLVSAQTYTEQAFKILDPAKTEVRYNSEWLETLGGSEWVRLLAQSTVARMLDRNDFASRYKNQTAIHLHEFLYPLLQGYDSVALESDLELGGSDQLFNLLVGRGLMPTYGKVPQMIMTMPLLEGIDAKVINGEVTGKKMSKSEGNYIGLSEEPIVMFRKIMQIDDDVIFRFFDLLSVKSPEQVDTLRQDRASGRDPREIKAVFAKEMLTRFHSAEAAEKASQEFRAVYSGDAIPSEVEEQTVTIETPTLWIAKALALTGLAKSTNDGRRLVEQNGVEVDQVRVTDLQLQLERGKRYLLRVGSKTRRFKYITVS